MVMASAPLEGCQRTVGVEILLVCWHVPLLLNIIGRTDTLLHNHCTVTVYSALPPLISVEALYAPRSLGRNLYILTATMNATLSKPYTPHLP